MAPDTVDRAKVREWMGNEGQRAAFDCAFPPPVVLPRCMTCGGETELTNSPACHHVRCSSHYYHACGAAGDTEAAAIAAYQRPLLLAEARGQAMALESFHTYLLNRGYSGVTRELVDRIATAHAEMRRLESGS